MAIAGALIGRAIGAFGKKPKIPEMPRIDPNQIQREALAGNEANMAQAQRIGASVNEFNQSQQLGMLSKALEFAAPGQLQKVQDITASQLRGEVPMDVQQSVMRSSAGQSFGRGIAGSQMASGLGLRSLGLTSLGIQQQGIGNFQSLAGLVPQTPLFDMTSMFFTPQQRLEFEFNQNQAIFQRNLLHEQVKAAPDPATAALGREVDRFFNTAASYGMTMAGSGGGGMGGMGGG